MYQALYRKYRPKTLDEICGQDTIVRIINNSIKNNKINHAYLFTGPRGTGKTSIAKIFAKMVNCENLQNGNPCGKCIVCQNENNSDIIEIDAASNNGVDEIREIRNKVNLVPAYGKYKVYIIDEVHMLTTGAFNALLKTLEEPPNHIIFILATTDPHKIPETILSRCQRFDFKKVTESNIIKRLQKIAQNEKIKVEEDALKEIARLSDGGMRDSIGLLDQAWNYSVDKITTEDIHNINGTITAEDLKELIVLINNQEIEKIFKKLDYYNNCGKNFIKLTEEIITFMRNILICKKAPIYFKEINNNIKIYEDLTKSIETSEIFKIIDILNETLLKMQKTNNPKLLLELAIIQILNNQETEQIEKINKNTNSPISDKNSNQKENKSDKNIFSSEKTTPSKIEKEANSKETNKPNIEINREKLKELSDIRINNTLANFQKKILLETKEKMDKLNTILLNPTYSKYASILLDGTLKAASQNHLIYVYENERLANLFNENIQNIEKTIEKITKKHYKVIATDINNWEKIKNDFNNKKKVYNYIEEEIPFNEIFKENKVENKLSDFEDIIEYE
ncbi:MAG: DNA polymerase III subunit gamma/tau [Bacilli bacterium]|nr:DNA polymerase III subunit gamma/tau [Bacilli bacterium]